MNEGDETMQEQGRDPFITGLWPTVYPKAKPFKVSILPSQLGLFLPRIKACSVLSVIYDRITRPRGLEYPSHAETANERNRRMLGKAFIPRPVDLKALRSKDAFVW